MQKFSQLLLRSKLRYGFVLLQKKSRTRPEIQRGGGNQNLRRIRSRQTDCALPRRREEKRSKFFPRKSRKERNKCKKAGNGNTNELALISADVTSWKKNFDEIVRLNPDIVAPQETKVTKAAKPAANRAAGSEKLSVVWRNPCDQLKKKREGKLVAVTPWMGRQGGVAVLAKNELGILAGGMEGKASCELYESARYVRVAIPVRHGNRNLFVHVASLYNENTGHNEVIKKMRNERALERAFTEAAALGDQAVFLCADINKTEAVSIDEAQMTGNWMDVGTRYTAEDEAEPTYAGFKKLGQTITWQKSHET